MTALSNLVSKLDCPQPELEKLFTREYCHVLLKKIDDKQKAIIKSFHKELVRNYLFGLAEYDKQNQERKFQNAEVKIYNAITIDGIKVKFGGIIDRIDLEGETLVLSDYKTGGDDESFKYIEDLFDSKKENRASRISLS